MAALLGRANARYEKGQQEEKTESGRNSLRKRRRIAALANNSRDLREFSDPLKIQAGHPA
jgi:hypothetical protein